MANQDRLLHLFHAFREQNEGAFRRAAEAIIADELAGNHHAFATELQRALGPSRNGGSGASVLRPLHADRRPVDDLLQFPRVGPEESRLLLCGEAKRHISRVLEEHRNRLKLAEHGYRPKAKLLFWGPPGCGKTLTAHYLAQQLGLPLGVLQLRAAISSFLGETAWRVQQVFHAASQTPMVLFFDEVDAIAKDRDDGHDVGELKRVVNSLLQAMDSFQAPCSVLVGASNHQYLLDEAIWRRFDAVIHFPLPSAAERETFLKHLLSGYSGPRKLDHRLSYWCG